MSLGVASWIDHAILNKGYAFDKGSGFVVLPKKNAMQKIEEQLGKAKIAGAKSEV